ncbi:MAG: N-acetyltransferase [Deltaproteobacteria bacterium]|nr:N-acetyltransferase [Deltaproteobacteria bacterium]
MGEGTATRRTAARRRRAVLVSAGRGQAPYVHPQALVETRDIGPRTRIWGFSHVQAGARVGADCNIGEQCFVEAGASIGDGVVVKNGVSLWAGVTIEAGVFIGPNVAFTNDPRPRSRVYHEQPAATVVREGASIGANATLLSRIEIGRYAMIGAGAVVTKSVPAFALVLGNPARVRGAVCGCGQTLRFTAGRAACACGRRFRRVRGKVEPAV